MANPSFSQIGKRDFSAQTNRQLAERGYEIVSIQAMPAYPGDVFCTATCYQLVDHKANGVFLRSFAEVKKIAATGEGAPEFEFVKV